MTPYLADPDVTLYCGDALETLRQLPDASVDMVATSPPFYGLRDYGVDGQIGLEETPDQWVDRLVAVFRECRRVLADHGTLWVEIGDSYSAGGLGPGADGAKQGTNAGSLLPDRKRAPEGYKPKDLLGQPWMLAFALRADGWYLRSEIIWHKPNAMPESVTDRPTKAHSTVFLLSKRPRYFYDADAIREPFVSGSMRNGFRGEYDGPSAYIGQQGPQHNSEPNTLDGSAGESPRGPDGRRQTTVTKGDNSEQHRDGERWPNQSGANARSVWTIPTEPTLFAHFATWPQALVRRMILAGTSERGKCPECGKPWVRDVEIGDLVGKDRGGNRKGQDVGPFVKNNPGTPGLSYQRTTLGWSPSCACHFGDGLGPRNPVPCVVLDPFAGSGTTLLVARNHGRHATGIELNADYCALASDRLAQLSLLSEAYEPAPVLAKARGLTGGAYSPPGQSPHSNARKPKP